MNSSVFLVIAVALSFAAVESRQQTTAGDPTNTAAQDTKNTRSGLSTPRDPYLISKSAIGSLRLEMTLDQARRANPSAKFERASDGDGAALVKVTLAPDAAVTLWAEEDDPEAPIDWSKRIKAIETFSPVFHTAEGVRPGSLVKHVETIFGRTREIVESELESRQYIVFESQPEFLTFRLDYTGIFSSGRRTREYEPEAKILSIAISSY